MEGAGFSFGEEVRRLGRVADEVIKDLGDRITAAYVTARGSSPAKAQEGQGLRSEAIAIPTASEAIDSDEEDVVFERQHGYSRKGAIREAMALDWSCEEDPISSILSPEEEEKRMDEILARGVKRGRPWTKEDDDLESMLDDYLTETMAKRGFFRTGWQISAYEERQLADQYVDSVMGEFCRMEPCLCDFCGGLDAYFGCITP